MGEREYRGMMKIINKLMIWWRYRRAVSRIRALRVAHALALADLELGWRRRFALVDKEKQEAEDCAVEAVRRVSEIRYRREPRTGLLSVTITIPAMEMAYHREGADAHFRQMARYVGRMVEREFAQINMATLAQSIKEAEHRQQRINEERHWGRGLFSHTLTAEERKPWPPPSRRNVTGTNTETGSVEE